MKRVYTKTLVAIIMAFAGVFIILYHQKIQNESIKKTEFVRGVFTKINLDITSIQYNILKSNYYLYYNNDTFNIKTNDIKVLLKNLLTDRYINKKTHKKTIKKISQLINELKKFDRDISYFLTQNSMLKNSNTILPKYFIKVSNLLNDNLPNEKKARNLLTKINFSLFIMKNGVDKTFIGGLKKHTLELKKILPYIKDRKKRVSLDTIIKHLQIFIHVFPEYSKTLNKILNSNIQNKVLGLEEIYLKESMKELKIVNQLDNFLLILYLGGILVILYFIFYSEKENRLLQQLYKKLQTSILRDHLTNLKNKKSFDIDYKNIENPVLILINIDKFSHINDFYGIKIGDLVLYESSKIIKKFSSTLNNSDAYRFSGDEFGILYECKENCEIEQISNDIINYFETNSLIIEDISINISVSIGANTGKDKLFEKAEIALMRARKSTRRRFFIYNDSLDMSKKIEQNIHSIKRLKDAIATNNIIPYFQPIVDIEKNKIIKYEALARLRDKDKRILSPFFFIDVALESKLSGVITIMMLENVIKVAKKNTYSYSINFSADDILDPQDSKKILEILEKNLQIANRITFEILESHEIRDEEYDIIVEFTKKLKSFGCEIAIDDFGSGYSNFEKLLKLDIDLLKIDGNIIKDIDKNKNSELILKTMINFAKNANIKVVAEFVHSKTVFEKIKEYKCDYAQGYYLGEPSPIPQNKILNTG